jgi:hypothetical protein
VCVCVCVSERERGERGVVVDVGGTQCSAVQCGQVRGNGCEVWMVWDQPYLYMLASQTS